MDVVESIIDKVKEINDKSLSKLEFLLSELILPLYARWKSVAGKVALTPSNHRTFLPNGDSGHHIITPRKIWHPTFSNWVEIYPDVSNLLN